MRDATSVPGRLLTVRGGGRRERQGKRVTADARAPTRRKSGAADLSRCRSDSANGTADWTLTAARSRFSLRATRLAGPRPRSRHFPARLRRPQAAAGPGRAKMPAGVSVGTQIEPNAPCQRGRACTRWAWRHGIRALSPGGGGVDGEVAQDVGPGNRSRRRLVSPYGGVSPPLTCVRSRRPNRWTMATLLDMASPVVIQTSVSPSCRTLCAGTAPARRHPL